jgi:hypothetical protein
VYEICTDHAAVAFSYPNLFCAPPNLPAFSNPISLHFQIQSLLARLQRWKMGLLQWMMSSLLLLLHATCID